MKFVRKFKNVSSCVTIQRQRLSLTSSHFAKVYLYVYVADTYRPHLVRCKTIETIILLEATTALRVRSLSGLSRNGSQALNMYTPNINAKVFLYFQSSYSNTLSKNELISRCRFVFTSRFPYCAVNIT